MLSERWHFNTQQQNTVCSSKSQPVSHRVNDWKDESLELPCAECLGEL